MLHFLEVKILNDVINSAQVELNNMHSDNDDNNTLARLTHLRHFLFVPCCLK